jgi:hypothetical protein
MKRSVLAAGIVATVAACAAREASAAPTLEYLFPAGGRRGGSVTVSAGGKFDTWPVQVWTDSPAIKARAGAEKGSFIFDIEAGAASGAHLARVYDASGASSPILFIVGDHPEALEVEPNDEGAKAQAIDSLPLIVNGRLEKRGDVDSFAVKLDAGQFLTAALLGRRIGAPMDPLLHLQDASGNAVAFSHDGLGLDPLLVYQAEHAGTYVLRVSAFAHPPAADVNFAGAPAAVYRLGLGSEPPMRFAIPAGVQRGTKAPIQLYGWSGHLMETREVDGCVGPLEDSIMLPTALPGECRRVAVGGGPEWIETGLAERSSASTPPFAVTGRLEKSGEEDTYPFVARKGERFAVSARSCALAAPMDLVWRVKNEKDEQVAGNDGETPPAPERGVFEAPADGVYRVAVADLMGRGGAEYVYRVALDRAVPTIAATLDADRYAAAPTQSVAIKVNVTRKDGHAGGLVAVAVDLPAGVTATSAPAPEKEGEVTLTLTAAADAKPANQPIRVMLLGTDPHRPEAWPAVFNVRPEIGQELLQTADQPWLTVLGKQ